MKRTVASLLFSSMILVVPAIGWSKGETLRIDIAGDNLAAPFEITDRTIVSKFNVWGNAFINTSKGAVEERPLGLQRVEVTFHIGARREPYATDTYIFAKYIIAYEIDSSNGRGYIYLPRWTPNSGVVDRGIEGNWFYASAQWDELVMPLIAQHATLTSKQANKGMLGCTIGTGVIKSDGIIELYLFDEHRNRVATYRYEPGDETYPSVKEHIGKIAPGEETEVSCWPRRRA